MKFIISLLIFSLSIYASQHNKPSEANLHVSAASAKTTILNTDESGAEYAVGFGISKVTDINIIGGDLLFAGNIDISYTDINLYKNGTSDNNDLSLLLNLKMGLEYSKVRLYLIGASRVSGGDDSFLGFGYGGGLEYRLTEMFALSAEYITYTMDSVKNNVVREDVDHDTTSIILKYYFK